jgi:acetyltransferase-like isoleucine patch superfamily enzyme
MKVLPLARAPSQLQATARRLIQSWYKYRSSAEFLALQYIGAIPSQRLRKVLYRHGGIEIGKNTAIYSGCHFRAPERISIGANTSIGDRCILDGRGGLSIGNSVNLSTGVYIWTADHDPQSPSFAGRTAAVTVHDYAWLSCRCTILPGVTIGEGAVVAAGAVVTKDVSGYTIVGGVPARVIGERNRDLQYQLGTWYHFF